MYDYQDCRPPSKALSPQPELISPWLAAGIASRHKQLAEERAKAAVKGFPAE
jgi:hypothetical protein